MYPRNAASPPEISIGAVVQIADGAVQTSGVSISVKAKGGSPAAGGGTTAYGTGGCVYYTPTQAETNYEEFIVEAYKTGCIPVSVTVVTTDSATAGTAKLAPVTHTSAVIPTVTDLTNNLAKYASGCVWINTVTGASGTVNYTNGIASNPSDTLENAATIATSLKLKRFWVQAGSALTASADYPNYIFDGGGYSLAISVAAANRNLSGSVLRNVEGLSSTGGNTVTAAAGEVVVENCHITNLRIGEADFIGCHLQGTVVCTQAIVPYRFDRCHGVGNLAQITLDAATQKLVVTKWGGYLTLAGMAAAKEAWIDGDGELVLDATCTGGTIYIAGNMTVTNNGSGMTIIDTSRWGEEQSVASVTGTVSANLAQILGTVLTESVGGYIAAAFKKFFDAVATSVPVASAVSQFSAATDKVFFGDGVHGGANTTIIAKKVTVAATGYDKAVEITSLGGTALEVISTSGKAVDIQALGTGSQAIALHILSADGGAPGISVRGGKGLVIASDVGSGIYVESGGHGVEICSGADGKAAIYLCGYAPGAGNALGLLVEGYGNLPGIRVTGGATGNGAEFIKGAGGAKDIDADEIDAILEDTGTTLPATLGMPAGASLAADIATRLAAAGYTAPANSTVAAIAALLAAVTEDDAGVPRFTQNALEQAPSGTFTGASLESIMAGMAALLAGSLAPSQIAARGVVLGSRRVIPKGDALTITHTFGADTDISGTRRAWLIVKDRRSDADADAIIHKEITIDDRTTTRSGHVDLTPTDTATVGHYEAEVYVTDADGASNVHTDYRQRWDIEKGVRG